MGIRVASNILNNNKLLKSKSGLSFFMLLALVAIVSFVFFSIGVSSSHVDAIYDKSFEATYAVDSLSSIGLYNNYYVKSLIANSLEDYKISFFNDLELESRLSDLKIDESNFLGCSYEGNLILYNEAYLSSQNITKSDELNKNLTYHSCFPSFSSGFSERFISYVDLELNKKFSTFFKGGNSQLMGVYVNFSNSELLVDVKYRISESIGSGEVYLSDEISTSYDLGNYDILVDTLGGILPLMSGEVKSSIISCKKTIDKTILDGDLFCVKSIFEKLFRAENSELFNKFNFVFSRVENSEVLNFYAFSVGVFDKESKKEVLDFSVVLENNLPIGQVDYSLKNYERLDNVIELDIVKPNLKNSTLNGFVVLYSYEEFLHGGTYSKYSDLINLLENSEIPDGFKNLGISNSVGEFRGSDKGSGLDLSLFFAKTLSFDEKGIMNLKIHQIWDEDLESFELLDNREVYFAVFAVDNRFKYFTDEGLLKEVFKGILPGRKLGPKPIAKENVKLNGAISGFDNSIEVEISNYDVEDVTNFEVYVVKGNSNNFVDVCFINFSLDCKKSSFNYSEGGNNKFLVSSNSGGLDISKYAKIIDTDFSLDDGSDIRIFIIPVNSERVGFYETVQLEYSLTRVRNFYELSNTPVRLTVFEFSTKIVDKRAPALSEIKDLSLNYNAGILNLVWSKTNLNSDVEKVFIAYTHSGGLVGSDGTRYETVDSSGVIKIYDFSTVEIIRAVPVDKNGLSEYHAGNILDAPVKSGIVLSK
jgi:hypothetical protein